MGTVQSIIVKIITIEMINFSRCFMSLTVKQDKVDFGRTEYKARIPLPQNIQPAKKYFII